MDQFSSKKIIIVFIITLTIASFANVGKSADVLPPVVTKTVPSSGDQNVSPSLKELQVTFSQKMMNNSWSLVEVNKESFPKISGALRYREDQKTLIVPVQLESDKNYIVWINSDNFHNFKDTQGIPAVPYLLTFHTRK
jgi:hypothetical protein